LVEIEVVLGRVGAAGGLLGVGLVAVGGHDGLEEDCCCRALLMETGCRE